MRLMRTLLLVMIILGLTQALAYEPVHTAPQAVSMTVSNPYCVQEVKTAGSCLINLRYFYASTTDSSFSHIEVAIDGKVRVHMNGFFENSAYLNGAMLGNGLKVACGAKMPVASRTWADNIPSRSRASPQAARPWLMLRMLRVRTIRVNSTCHS